MALGFRPVSGNGLFPARIDRTRSTTRGFAETVRRGVRFPFTDDSLFRHAKNNDGGMRAIFDDDSNTRDDSKSLLWFCYDDNVQTLKSHRYRRDHCQTTCNVYMKRLAFGVYVSDQRYCV